MMLGVHELNLLFHSVPETWIWIGKFCGLCGSLLAANAKQLLAELIKMCQNIVW